LLQHTAVNPSEKLTFAKEVDSDPEQNVGKGLLWAHAVTGKWFLLFHSSFFTVSAEREKVGGIHVVGDKYPILSPLTRHRSTRIAAI
jgi:hypothetical protein